jgi:hypothetical protein
MTMEKIALMSPHAIHVPRDHAAKAPIGTPIENSACAAGDTLPVATATASEIAALGSVAKSKM